MGRIQPWLHPPLLVLYLGTDSIGGQRLGFPSRCDWKMAVVVLDIFRIFILFTPQPVSTPERLRERDCIQPIHVVTLQSSLENQNGAKSGDRREPA